MRADRGYAKVSPGRAKVASEPAKQPPDESENATRADVEAGLTGVLHAIDLLPERNHAEVAKMRADLANWNASMIERDKALSRLVIAFMVAVIVMLATVLVFDRIVPLFFP